jgi:ADP-ribosylglycohydrolase
MPRKQATNSIRKSKEAKQSEIASSPKRKETTKQMFLDCFLGGAIGSALGVPLDVYPAERIKEQYAEGVLTDYMEVFGRKGSITAALQMTLFSAEGLMRHHYRLSSHGIAHLISWVQSSDVSWFSLRNL